jgi:hypothetical protein
MFLFIFIFIIAGQVIIVCFGGYAFKVSLDIISGEQWGIGFAFGVGQWFIDYLIKFLPDSVCPSFGTKEKDPLQEVKNDVIGILRKNRSQSFSIRNNHPSGSREGSLLK